MRHLHALCWVWSLWAASALGMTATALAQAANRDTQVPVHGTVVSVDRARATVVLRYARPGSEPQTKHLFALENRNDVFRLHPRAVIDGTMDTTRKPWVLTNVNVESDRPLKGQIGP